MAKGTSAGSAAVVQQELGTLEVADQVFRELVRRVVAEEPGVAAVRRAPTGFFRRSSGDAIRLERGQGEVAISINLSVRYDVRIPEMVEALRERIKAAVSQTTGYSVRAVNVTVDHILPPKSEEEEAKPPQDAVPEPRGDEAPEPPPMPEAK